MKTLCKLSLIAIAGIGLAGCASSSLKPFRLGKTAAQHGPSLKSTTSSTINLSVNNGQLIANVVTNWDPKANDILAIQWQAPKNSYCQNSQFPITQAHQQHDRSWAYRTLIHDAQVCNGLWAARVVNLSSGKVLATASYQVNVVKTPAPAANTIAPAPAAS